MTVKVMCEEHGTTVEWVESSWETPGGQSITRGLLQVRCSAHCSENPGHPDYVPDNHEEE